MCACRLSYDALVRKKKQQEKDDCTEKDGLAKQLGSAKRQMLNLQAQMKEFNTTLASPKVSSQAWPSLCHGS